MPREKNYTLGAGKLFFDRFDATGASTGELYIGNTPSLTYSSDEERQEHFSSDEKGRDKDASVVIRSDSTIGFTTDDIQPANLAMIVKGEAETLTTVAAMNETENLTVRKGRWYQLGVTPTEPTGIRAITLDSVTNDAMVPVALPGGNGGANFEVDLALGRLFIKEDAPDVVDGDIIVVTYDVLASSRTIVISAGDSIRGSMRYVADNTQGANIDHYWPLVEISPDGDYEFKGDDWSEMSFSGEVLKSGALAKHYIDGRAVTA